MEKYEMWAEREIKRLQSEVAGYREALQEFVDRCERGEVRSTYTYNKFKRLLVGVPSLGKNTPRKEVVCELCAKGFQKFGDQHYDEGGFLGLCKREVPE